MSAPPPFGRLIEDHAQVVLRVCRVLLGPTDAEDAWSETFLAALEAYPRLRPDSNLRGWLVTIAYRKAIDQLRARERTPTPTDDLPEASTVDVMPSDSDSALWRTLEALPFKQRAAVTGHYLAGLAYAEVATALGGSEVAARRAAADGVANLRKTYRREAAS